MPETETEAEKIQRLELLVKNLEGSIKTIQNRQPGNGVQEVTSYDHYAARMPAPRLVEDMTIEEYEASVETWQQVGGVPKNRQGAVLLAGLPVRGDKAGGLQKLVLNKVKDKLNTENGADEVIKAVKKVLCKPTYYRLIDWVDETFSARQKAGWMMQKWIGAHEGRMKKAKDEFGMDIPPILDVALLIRGVTSIEPGIMAALLKDEDLSGETEGANLVENVKDILVKVPLSNTSNSKANAVKYAREQDETDVFGKPIKRKRSSIEYEEDGEDEEVLYSKGKKVGKFPRRGLEKKVPTKQWESEKERCMKLGLCFKCKSPDHRLGECPVKKQEIAEKKKEVFARGQLWDRRDGTFELPNGEIVQKRTNEQFYVEHRQQVVDEKEDVVMYDAPMPLPLCPLPEVEVDLNNVDKILNEIDEDTPDIVMDDDQMAKILDQVDIDEVLFTDQVNVKQILVTSHLKNEAVMDTGCSRCCAGIEWTDNYLKDLSEVDKKYVQVRPSQSRFKFGDDQVYVSRGFVVAPIYFGGKRKMLGWDKIEAKIPLLISLKVMMKLGLTLKFREEGPNVAEFEGTKIDLAMREGHIWVNVSPPEQQFLSQQEHDVLLTSKQLKKTDITKLHVQMAHPPKEKLIRIISRAGHWDEDIKRTVDEIYEECLSKDCRARDACQKMRKVGCRLPEKVGDMVCADLKIAGKNSSDKDILYIIDMFSNYVLADTIDSKRPAQIVEKFLELWYSRGLPRIKTLITDCGSEFLGNDMERFVEHLNIKHITTVPRTPAMNGQCERVHALVDGNIERLRQNQPGLSQSQALRWAMYAWNTEEKRHGYSPADLVFGPVDRDVCFVDIGPTQLQQPDVSVQILEQLKARETARIEHLKVKASDKVREALYRKTIPTREKKVLGTWVWVKRSLENEWRGPGQICDSLNASCSVKIGNNFFTARHEDCLPLNQREMEMAGLLNDEVDQPEPYTLLDPVEIEVTRVTRSRIRDNDNVQAQQQDEVQQQGEVQQHDNPAEQPEGRQGETVVQPTGRQQPKQKSNLRKKGNGKKKVVTFSSELGLEERQVIQVNVVGKGWTDVSIMARHKPTKPDEGEWYKVKFDPKNPRAVAILDLKTIDWRKKEDEQQVSQNLLVGDEVSQVLVVKVPQEQHNSERVKAAKKKELETLEQFGTFKEVQLDSLTPAQKAKMIPSTWSVVLKDANNQESIKCRLCARGDRETEQVRTDCPTVSRQSLRLLLTVAASKRYKINSLDFKGAFLQGQPIDREVFLLPPQDVREQKPGMVWKVVKRLYGFRDSSRGWYLEFHSAMMKLGCEVVNTDAAMYVYKNKTGKIIGWAGVHVDDVLYAGEPEFHDEVIKMLLKQYVIGSVESELFTFTGWTLQQDRTGITLTQDHFLEQVDMSKFDLLQRLQGREDEILNETLQAEYRSLVGSLQWIVSISRPDKAYYTVALASKLGKATVGDAKMGLKHMKNMLSNPQKIKFSALQDIEDCHLRSFCDSSWAKLAGCETVVANLTFLVDSSGRANIIDWQANKLPIPAASPLTGEAAAALDSYGKIVWLKDLAKDFLGKDGIPAVIVTDSKSLEQAVRTTTSLKDKRALVTISTLRRIPAMEGIEIIWCQAGDQLADILTKPGVKADKLRQILSTGQLSLLEMS